MSSLKRIGLFGGTFDPIHLGHINLAIALKERGELQEVWFILASCSPFRINERSFFGADRLKMVELAIEGIPGFKLLDLEMKRQGPSYTIDTIRELIALHPDKQFSLLLGEDAALGFPRWKEAEEIVSLVKILVGSRSNVDLLKKMEKDPLFSRKLAENIQKGMVQTPLFDIEGTNIRKRLEQKLYCGHLLPSKVLDYIS
jgi:nicotinate-nucleotide adenylyltransferase